MDLTTEVPPGSAAAIVAKLASSFDARRNPETSVRYRVISCGKAFS